MPRSLRIEYPHAIYHVLARGNRRGAIVLDDDDRWMLIRTLGEMAKRTGILVHAYALMDNHYHFVIETPRGNLVAGMQWFQTTYTQRFNAKNGLWGHLFGGRYKAIVVQGGGEGYFRRLIDYVHLNPVRAGLVPEGGGFDDYQWTSLREYRKPPSKRFPWMRSVEALAEMGCKDTPAGRRKFIERLETLVDWTSPTEAGRIVWKGQSLQSTLRRGWYFGTQEFRERLLAKFGVEEGIGERVAKVIRSNDASARDRDRSVGARIIAAGLDHFGLAKEDLNSMQKNDWRKAMLAMIITETTSLSHEWIASQLKMGHKTSVSRLSSQMKNEIRTNRKLRKTKAEITRISS